MKRRTILRRGGALGALALAGCVATDGGDQGDPTTTDPTETPTTTPTETPTETPTVDPVGVVDRSISTVANDCHRGDTGTSVSVSIDADTGRVTVTGTMKTPTPCYQATLRTVAWDGDAETLAIDVSATSTGEPCIECVGAVDYRATVTMKGVLPETVEISHDGSPVETSEPNGESDDGSGSDASDGEVTEPTPALASTDLEVTGVDHADENQSGDIEFQHETTSVVVTGTVRARNGCEIPALETVAYDAVEDVLSVEVVAAVPPEDEEKACTQVIRHVDYRATVRFENALPTTVEVSQDGHGGMGASHASASAEATASN